MTWQCTEVIGLLALHKLLGAEQQGPARGSLVVARLSLHTTYNLEYRYYCYYHFFIIIILVIVAIIIILTIIIMF
jgi:hypothetical protein